MKIPTHPLSDLHISKFTQKSFDEFLDHILKKGDRHHLITIYSEYLVRAKTDPHFKTILQKAHTITADGIGPIWAAHFLDKAKGKHPLTKLFHLVTSGAGLIFNPKTAKQIFPARISGADFWLNICQKCETKNLTVFLHNKPDGLSSFEEVKKALLKKFPKLKIEGHFDLSDPLKKIKTIKPHVIFSALGVPHQDHFLADILPKSPSVKLGIGIGASFDFLTGNQKRAPKWMQKTGLEWSWRLLTRPKRLPRIWKATISFIQTIWQESKK